MMAKDKQASVIMVELEPAAIYLLINEEFLNGIHEKLPDPAAVSLLRSVSAVAPDRSSDRGPVYRVDIGRAPAEHLSDYCEGVGSILETFPDQEHRADGAVLLRAARDFEEALKPSE
jgi:hypothetical protein